MQQVVAGYEVGRGHDQMLFRRVGGGEQRLMDQIFRKARPGGDRVDGMPTGLFKRHDIDVRRRWQNTLSGLDLPVTGVDDAHRGRNRAFHARHQVNPLPDPRVLLKVAGIDQIHAAGVGDIVIDHYHFTMLAQVHPAQKHTHQIDLESLDHFNAGVTHHRRPWATEKGHTARGVEHQPAVNPATGGGH